MRPFTPDELTRLRTRAATRLFDTAVVSEPSFTDDGSGGQLPGIPTTRTIPCSIIRSATAATGAQEREEMGTIVAQQGFVLRFPYGTQIVNTASVTIDTRHFEIRGRLDGTFAITTNYAVVER